MPCDCFEESVCFGWLGNSFRRNEASQPPLRRDSASFFDCEEGDESHTDQLLLARAREQLNLNRSGSVLIASLTGLLRHTSSLLNSVAARIDSATAPAKLSINSQAHALPAVTHWLGNTIPEKLGDSPPMAAHGPCWQRGSGTGLQVRKGPNYAKTGKKMQCDRIMYDCICCDAIQSRGPIEDIIGRLMNVSELPVYKNMDDALRWSAELGIPRIICINLQLPYANPLNMFAKDDGCSLVCFFHVRPDTLRVAHQIDASEQALVDLQRAIRILRTFFEGPAGTPGGAASDPNRSLAKRRQEGKPYDLQGGLLKLIGKCDNPSEISVPRQAYRYNGKPALIMKSGYIRKDPGGEWLEMGIDFRGFNALARTMLYTCRSVIPRARVHFGFLIQSIDDEDMPEVLIGDIRACGIDIEKQARLID